MGLEITTSNETINGVKGWSIRSIFSQTIPQLIDITSTNYFESLLTGSYKGLNKGNLPPNYWHEGKLIRIKGTFLYSTSTSERLDMIVSITDNINTITAQPNDGNPHDFASGNALVNVPVNFEIIMCRGEHDFSVSGFYQYEWGSYNSGGVNSKVVYVPITPNTDTTLDFTQTTTISLNVVDDRVNMIHCTVEELS